MSIRAADTHELVGWVLHFGSGVQAAKKTLPKSCQVSFWSVFPTQVKVNRLVFLLLPARTRCRKALSMRSKRGKEPTMSEFMERTRIPLDNKDPNHIITGNLEVKD